MHMHTVLFLLIVFAGIALIGVGVKAHRDKESVKAAATQLDQTIVSDTKADADKVVTSVTTDIHKLDAGVVAEVGKLETAGTLVAGTTQNLVDAHTAQVAAQTTSIAAAAAPAPKPIIVDPRNGY